MAGLSRLGERLRATRTDATTADERSRHSGRRAELAAWAEPRLSTGELAVAIGLPGAPSRETTRKVVRSQSPAQRNRRTRPNTAARGVIGLEFDIVWCPHPAGRIGCWCRKPRPRMGVWLARRHGLDLDACHVAGDPDSDRDFAAGIGAGFTHTHDFFDATAPLP